MYKIEVARALRKRETPSERLLWGQLRGRKALGFKFKRQHLIRGFVVDFYCPALKLALEIDGGIHAGQQEYDEFRQSAIEKDGIEFLRINAKDIDQALPMITARIQKREQETAELIPRGSPSPITMGEGSGVRAPFLPSLLHFWSTHNFDPAGKILLLAVSGGCDSTAMLELFHREVAPRTDCKLFAIHINHHLRPASDADQVFVENLCRERKIPLQTVALHPEKRARGQSVEMWGRERRYQAFARVRKNLGADFILTAHHRDDVAETFCLRMWRGTGLAGMRGIAFRRDDGVLRPLLPVPRADLEAWLIAIGTAWREDESNADEEIPRNWVRHRLLPAWRKDEPDLDATLFRLSQTATELLPALEKWRRAIYPSEDVADRGGIPMEWLREEGADSDVLRATLPLLGIAKPAPEMLAEILRQAKESRRIEVRVDEERILTEKQGILVMRQRQKTQ